MSIVPLWKLKREFARLAAHVAGGPTYVFQYLTATPYYDRFMAKRSKVHVGALPMSGRIGLYLIFPQNGLLRSHLRALDHLIDNGYAPLVVSNLPLGEADLSLLKSRSFRVIERVNFGYDFGGYRDGILSLAKDFPRLERLVLLNDSSWFPLPGAMNWLQESEALGVDYAAAAWSGGVRRPAPAEFAKIEWRVDKSRRNFHYASFALNIDGRVLSDPGFMEFWRTFRLTQDKNRTVRRGEIGLTAWIMRHGYSHAATTELYDMDERLMAMSDKDLRAVFDRLIILDDPELNQIRKMVAQKTGHDRRRLEKLILMVAARRGASYALADYLVRTMRFAFLKKSPVNMKDGTDKIISALARDMPGPFGADILREIGQSRADRPALPDLKLQDTAA